MFRKFVIAAAAVAAVGVSALTVSATSAEAGWKGKHFGIHFGHAWYGGHYAWGPRYAHYYDGCIRHRWVVNRFGETVLRRVNVCY
ncbi:MAG: hypothetical protein FJX62_16970 [Alphaproteobacteria bacterium]|nr:hypothetical protein [Alphaproteobacteria bacterium]